MSKESKARYQYYESNIYRQTIESVHNYRAKMYYGMPLHEVPSILNATIAAKRKAKKEAKKMVRWDKRTAKANGWKLSEMPRTEWAENIYE